MSGPNHNQADEACHCYECAGYLATDPPQGGVVVSGDQLNLDLDLILWRAHEADTFGLSPATLETIVAEDVPALVAEVRRLRDKVARVEELEPDWSDIGQVHTADDLRTALKD